MAGAPTEIVDVDEVGKSVYVCGDDIQSDDPQLLDFANGRDQRFVCLQISNGGPKIGADAPFCVCHFETIAGFHLGECISARDPKPCGLQDSCRRCVGVGAGVGHTVFKTRLCAYGARAHGDVSVVMRSVLPEAC